MAGRKKGELSQEPRAVKRREETAARKAVKGVPFADPGDPTVSTEPIVVESPAKKTVPEQKYHCANCLGPVVRSDAYCPTCEVRLGWEG
jgi:hypothetical protein